MADDFKVFDRGGEKCRGCDGPIYGFTARNLGHRKLHNEADCLVLKLHTASERIEAAREIVYDALEKARLTNALGERMTAWLVSTDEAPK